MEEKEEIIDQSVLAEDVAGKIKYEFPDFFLVKPLDPVKVKKEFSTPVTSGKTTKDENGIEAQDFDEVKTEIKEVDSDYRRGIVLKRPLYYENPENERGVFEVKIGDIVLFKETSGLRFDLLKDSRLIRLYDIVGIER